MNTLYHAHNLKNDTMFLNICFKKKESRLIAQREYQCVCVYVYVSVCAKYLNTLKPLRDLACYFKAYSDKHLAQLCYRKILPNIYGTTNPNMQSFPITGKREHLQLIS